MEFHNERVLPGGLAKVLYDVTPPEIRADLRVVAYPRRPDVVVNGDRRHAIGRGVIATAHCAWPDSPSLHLFSYPISSQASEDAGAYTFSFSLWRAFLSVSLHEVGHLVTIHGGRCFEDPGHRYERDSGFHLFVEQMADDWRDGALARIARDSPRLGQPIGPLTGLPGRWAHKLRSVESRHPRMLAERRGSWADGQVTCHGVLGMTLELVGWSKYPEMRQGPYYHRLLRHIAKVAESHGITRFYMSKQGRRYRQFNYGEACLVAREAARTITLELEEDKRALVTGRWPKWAWELPEPPDIVRASYLDPHPLLHPYELKDEDEGAPWAEGHEESELPF